jgi:hypothetical protein
MRKTKHEFELRLDDNARGRSRFNKLAKLYSSNIAVIHSQHSQKVRVNI